MGGGFIEFLFGGGQPVAAPRPPGEVYAHAGHAMPDPVEVDPRRLPPDPKFLKQVVPYSGKEKPGTIVIDTPQRFLFLVQNDGTALRYGIGVGRDGFTWAGVKTVSAKKEWPDWRPPEEMLQRRPDLPGFMAGGPENPLGARAMYLGSSLYRIHGSNEPWTIGQAVSSGCIRHAQRGRHRPLRPRQGRHQGRRDVARLAAHELKRPPSPAAFLFG